MARPTGPRAVFERLSEGISAGRWHELADLYAEDAVVDQPFGALAPARTEGRETIRAHFAAAATTDLKLVARNVVVHETTDPEVIVAEFDYDITGTVGSVTAANIQVLRVRDGLIAVTHDYHDHLAIARANGRVPALVAALEGAARSEAVTRVTSVTSVTEPRSPAREAFERLIDGVTHGRWDELPELYTEDAVVVHPFATPREPLIGREALRRHFAAATTMNLELTARDIAVYQTTDPEVVIGEFAYVGRITTTGREFRVPNIFVLRVRDGLIAESRDYADHLSFARATGRLNDLISAATQG
jgi:ketosteroid isomerase-like protein